MTVMVVSHKEAWTSLCGTFQVSTKMKHSANSETPTLLVLVRREHRLESQGDMNSSHCLGLFLNILAERPRTTSLTKAFYALKLGDYIYPPSVMRTK